MRTRENKWSRIDANLGKLYVVITHCWMVTKRTKTYDREKNLLNNIKFWQTKNNNCLFLPFGLIINLVAKLKITRIPEYLKKQNLQKTHFYEIFFIRSLKHFKNLSSLTEEWFSICLINFKSLFRKKLAKLMNLQFNKLFESIFQC